MPQAIEIKNLKKYFGSTKALDGVTFEVQEGEIFGFLGPNGAGKTTTIRSIMDFIHPDSGEIKIFGLDSIKDYVSIKKMIGYVSADINLYNNYTSQDHFDYLENINGQKSIARELAKKLDLNTKVKFRNLSTGNKRKLALILALMFEPRLLLLDEPTAGLDPILQNDVYKILEEMKQRGVTIFMSSHNLAEVDRICSRVAIIKSGKIVATENIQELKNKRLHIVTVRFSDKFNKTDFHFDGVEVREEINEGLILAVKGDINPLMNKLSKLKLKDLEISHASLEEVFLEFYKK